MFTFLKDLPHAFPYMEEMGWKKGYEFWKTYVKDIDNPKHISDLVDELKESDPTWKEMLDKHYTNWNEKYN